MYAIAESRSDEAGAAVATMRFVATGARGGWPRCGWRGGAVEWCPLGVALQLMGYDLPPAPTGREVAAALAGRAARPEWRAVAQAAVAFIRDGDGGRISDLAAAWGVVGGAAPGGGRLTLAPRRGRRGSMSWQPVGVAAVGACRTNGRLRDDGGKAAERRAAWQKTVALAMPQSTSQTVAPPPAGETLP